MPKGYWIGHVVVDDPKAYEAYRAANAEAFEKYNAKFLVRGGSQEVKEGQAKPRTVVLEFPSYQDALDCYHSIEYQRAFAIRSPISMADMVIVEGYDA